MAIKSLATVSCSLNLGLIYRVGYSYSIREGVRISLTFVNESGNYAVPQLIPLHQVFINLGGSAFSVYPVSYKLNKAGGRRVIDVEFVDGLFRLDHYLIVQPGRGCGLNVFQLGTPVDNRSDAEKVSASLDKTAQQIANFTQFPDYEHTFPQFIAVLQQRIPVSLQAALDPTIACYNNFTGTFREVLNRWCAYYNLSFFLENGVIKIFDPTRLVIVFPPQPADALEYDVEEDCRSTYGKTVFNWYQQDGGEYALSQTNSNSGPAFVRENTLFPVGYEFNLPQLLTPGSAGMLQVAAAMYGQEFWFLYNYAKGTATSECGFSPVDNQTLAAATNLSLTSLNLSVSAAILNQDVFNSKFEAYSTFGQKIAGRWYLSEEIGDIAIDQSFTWFNESNGQIFSFADAQSQEIQLTFVTPPDATTQVIPQTVVNQYYPGVNYVGARILYEDNTPLNITGNFPMPGALKGLIDSTYQQLSTTPGSSSMDFSELSTLLTGANRFVGYDPNVGFPQDVSNLILDIPNQVGVFAPRFNSFPIKGISSSDYTSLKGSQGSANTVAIVSTNQGPNVVGNTSVIKTVQAGAYSAYYDKFQACAYASTADIYYGFEFEPHQISTDNQVGIAFSKGAANTYSINRDYAFINGLVNNPLLPLLAQPRTFNTKKVTFTLNYFYAVPVNFLTNGLTSMDLEIGDGGLTASYTFSNEVLAVPNYEERFNQLEQKMKNTWIRTYRPKQTIS